MILENEFPTPPLNKGGWPWKITVFPEVNSGRASYPRITIITPSFNQGKFLEQTIRSVLLQNYPNLEFIIIDGGSTDNSIDIIKKYEKYLTYWESEPDTGQSHAINKGFAKSTGQILAWLNSDDYYTPGTLHLVAEELNKSETYALVGNCLTVFTDGTPPRKDDGDFENLFKLLEFWKGYNMPQTSIFWRREVFEKVGFLNEELHYIMDFDYWIRIAAHHNFKNIDHVLSYATYHDEAKTGDNYKIYYEQLRRHAKEYWKKYAPKDYKALETSLEEYDNLRLKISKAIDKITDIIPLNSSFILVDEDQWETDNIIGERHRVPFLEKDGRYYGKPADDESAITEIERLRQKGATYIFFAWQCFWWLDHYRAMHDHLTCSYECILNNEILLGFLLDKPED